jgi:hypothetical protein
MPTVYVLKNEVGRYNTFFLIFTRNPHLCRFRVESINIFVCAIHVLFLRKQFRTCANSLPNRFTL